MGQREFGSSGVQTSVLLTGSMVTVMAAWTAPSSMSTDEDLAMKSTPATARCSLTTDDAGSVL